MNESLNELIEPTYMLKVVAWTHDENFGDALGPVLISRLATSRVKEKGATMDFKGAILSVGSRLRRHRSHPFTQPVWPWDTNLILSIGSIMQFANKETIVWGTGCISPWDTPSGVKEVRAVRGPLSAQRLKELGYPTTNVFGDPALLLPLIYSPAIEKVYNFGIIPHYTEYSAMKEMKTINPSVRYINLGVKDVENVVAQIMACRLTLSTSLHGLIVSHAYGIPSLWVRRNNLAGGAFKFHDYFMSVGIPVYDGIEIGEIDMSSTENIQELFKKFREYALPKVDMAAIRRLLLDCAPFELKEEYRKQPLLK